VCVCVYTEAAQAWSSRVQEKGFINNQNGTTIHNG